MGNKVGIYIHIPFCAKKCPYCDFYSERYSAEMASNYVDAILTDMEQYSGIKADTLYFGGGTPSLIKPQLIEKIIDQAYKHYSLSGEVTIEANPNTLTGERVWAYKAAGINRLSLGMQSANARELAVLGRSHTEAQLLQAVHDAVACGISNISLDIMLGTPYQTEQSLRQTLTEIFALPITHLSAYMLKVEEGTAYFNNSILSHCTDEDTLCDMYEQMVQACNLNGLQQYEISNFSKPGYESKHNLKYWQMEDYLGFGASAHSFYQGKRFYYKSSITDYIAERTILIEPIDEMLERIMLALRLCKGIDLSIFSGAQKKAIIPFIEQLKEMAEIRDNRLILMPKGMLISNQIINKIVALVK